MKLGRLIKAYRWKHEIGVRAIAKEIGISHSTLNKFENEGGGIDGENLKKILFWIMTDNKEQTK